MELRGNIRVFLRVRPLSRRERDDGETAALVPHGGLEARLSRPSLSGSRSFAMDAVFGPDASQSDGQRVEYPAGVEECKVLLTQVVRSSERISSAAAAFKLNKDNDKDGERCKTTNLHQV